MTLITMTRPQKTVFGTLHTGVFYRIKPQKPAEKKALQTLLDKGFATKRTEKELMAAQAAAKATGDEAAEEEAAEEDSSDQKD